MSNDRVPASISWNVIYSSLEKDKYDAFLKILITPVVKNSNKDHKLEISKANSSISFSKYEFKHILEHS